jgi:hypothetical protein
MWKPERPKHRRPAALFANTPRRGEGHGVRLPYVYNMRKPRRHDEEERPRKLIREPVRAMSRSELYQYYKTIGMLREFYRLYPNPRG